MLAETQAAVKASMDDVRRIAQELRPETLDHLGLASALTHLSRTFADRTGIAVRRRFDSSLPPLDPYVELVVYRVAQESLTNAAKHSGASAVSLTLERDDDGVVLRVIDDGRGFGNGPARGRGAARHQGERAGRGRQRRDQARGRGRRRGAAARAGARGGLTCRRRS